MGDGGTRAVSGVHPMCWLWDITIRGTLGCETEEARGLLLSHLLSYNVRLCFVALTDHALTIHFHSADPESYNSFALNDPSPASFGNGVLRSTAVELMKLLIPDETEQRFQKAGTPAYGYWSGVSSNTVQRRQRREVWFQVAGISGGVYIKWTRTGPSMVSPFWIARALEPNPFRLVRRDFVRLLDREIATQFFKRLEEVEQRWQEQRTPLLEPFSDWYLACRGEDVSSLIGFALFESCCDSLNVDFPW